MKKLNFGCGDKIAEGWTNIDFHSANSDVKRVNLLTGFPYPDNYFDVVYSSHVLEHFTKSQALYLLKESFRVLKPNGILRIAVPDLESSCQEYLRILNLPEDDQNKSALYEWIIIELLDQLVRLRTRGEMGDFLEKTQNSDNNFLKEYIRSRTETHFTSPPLPSTFFNKIRKITPQLISTKLVYWYLGILKKLIPKNLRNLVLVETGIGERHQWMYDKYGLINLFKKAGFDQCNSSKFNESSINQFNESYLDCNTDGTTYKGNSIYIEAKKPL